MAQTPTNKFSLWFNCQPDGANHKYWAVSEIPIDEMRKAAEDYLRSKKQ